MFLTAAGAVYRLKAWERGSGEPGAWDIVREVSRERETSGSFLLVAHHVDATFGDLTGRPIGRGAIARFAHWLLTPLRRMRR